MAEPELAVIARHSAKSEISSARKALRGRIADAIADLKLVASDSDETTQTMLLSNVPLLEEANRSISRALSGK